MADPLYEILAPYFDTPSPRPAPSPKDAVTTSYLTRLTTLPLSSLNTTEPQALSQTSHSLLLSLQKLSTRSHKSVISSSSHLSTLRTTLPALAKSTADLRDAIPRLDSQAVHFSETYNKNASNAVLDRRRKALLLSRNVDRLADILDLPTLLSSAITASSVTGTSNGASTASATANYASALDLNAHIRRLQTLYPESKLIASVHAQAEEAMQAMTSNLIASLKAPGVKLAAAMRTISWLRRVAPELDTSSTSSQAISSTSSNKEGSLGALFLVCRLANLITTLNALEPLRDLADQETMRKPPSNGAQAGGSGTAWAGGQQTERYLKRYIEIFREQSFAIISMYRSIFPSVSAEESLSAAFIPPGTNKPTDNDKLGDPLQPLPSALASFPMYLVDMLAETLKTYLPNVQDRASKDSLLTQVLYCAGSLGRLGGDFGMVLAELGDDDEGEEWCEVVKKHRVLAGRLESMVGSRE